MSRYNQRKSLTSTARGCAMYRLHVIERDDNLGKRTFEAEGTIDGLPHLQTVLTGDDLMLREQWFGDGTTKSVL